MNFLFKDNKYFYKATTMSISYIITHRQSTLDRKNNLEYVLNYVNNIDRDIEVILVEQDHISKIDQTKLSKKVRHIFLPSESLFNRSLGFNIGFKYSTGKVLIFADNDIIIAEDLLLKAYELCLNKCEAISPFTKLIDLPKDETEHLIKGELSLKSVKIDCHPTREGISFCSAMTFFNRAAYLGLGGFDERFIGWGAEDYAMSNYKIPLLKYALSLESIGFHLWHERLDTDSHLQPNYYNNLRLLKEYQNYSSIELLRLCESSKKRLLLG